MIFYNIRGQVGPVCQQKYKYKYISHGLNLTDNQLEKIIRASKNNQGVVVQITKDNLNGNSHKIPLTKTQINKITKANTV